MFPLSYSVSYSLNLFTEPIHCSMQCPIHCLIQYSTPKSPKSDGNLPTPPIFQLPQIPSPSTCTSLQPLPFPLTTYLTPLNHALLVLSPHLTSPPCKTYTKFDPRGNRTPNLRVWNPTRCHCAMGSYNNICKVS